MNIVLDCTLINNYESGADLPEGDCKCSVISIFLSNLSALPSFEICNNAFPSYSVLNLEKSVFVQLCCDSELHAKGAMLQLSESVVRSCAW